MRTLANRVLPVAGAVVLLGGCGPSAAGAGQVPRPSDTPAATASPPPATPAKTQNTGAAPDATTGPAPAQSSSGSTSPPLGDVLTRDPRGDQRCHGPFPSFWTWEDRDGAVSSLALVRVIWRDPAHGDDNPLVSHEDPRAAQARCIAVGPHRRLNLANWCCRPEPTPARSMAKKSGP